MGFCSATKKKEIVSFASKYNTTGDISSEVNQVQKAMFSLICRI
jgi:hypothetical protein